MRMRRRPRRRMAPCSPGGVAVVGMHTGYVLPMCIGMVRIRTLRRSRRMRRRQRLRRRQRRKRTPWSPDGVAVVGRRIVPV